MFSHVSRKPQAPQGRISGAIKRPDRATGGVAQAVRATDGATAGAVHYPLQQQIDAANAETKKLQAAFAEEQANWEQELADANAVAGAGAAEANNAYAVTATQTEAPAAQTTQAIKPKKKNKSSLKIGSGARLSRPLALAQHRSLTMCSGNSKRKKAKREAKSRSGKPSVGSVSLTVSHASASKSHEHSRPSCAAATQAGAAEDRAKEEGRCGHACAQEQGHKLKAQQAAAEVQAEKTRCRSGGGRLLRSLRTGRFLSGPICNAVKTQQACWRSPLNDCLAEHRSTAVDLARFQLRHLIHEESPGPLRATAAGAEPVAGPGTPFGVSTIPYLIPRSNTPIPDNTDDLCCRGTESASAGRTTWRRSC